MSNETEDKLSSDYQTLLENEIAAREQVVKLGYELVSRDDLSQKKLEDWDRFYHKEEAGRGRSTDAGRFVRAAIRAKWFEDGLSPNIGDVAKMKGWQIRIIEKAINALYVVEITPDPNF